MENATVVTLFGRQAQARAAAAAVAAAGQDVNRSRPVAPVREMRSWPGEWDEPAGSTPVAEHTRLARYSAWPTSFLVNETNIDI